MDIASASAAVQAAANGTKSSSASAALTGNFDTFLTLLTTQLQLRHVRLRPLAVLRPVVAVGAAAEE